MHRKCRITVSWALCGAPTQSLGCCCSRGGALQGMLVLAAATQHAEGHEEHAGAAGGVQAGAQLQPQVRRHESASSDNEYSEGQYAPPQRAPPRTAGHLESEEEKKEKR